MSATVSTTDRTETTFVSKGAFDVDWRRVLNTGGLLALGLCFISLAGMPIGLNGRKLIEPVLSLGYLSLLWLPLVIGWTVGNETVLEGMAAAKRGGRDIVAGAAVGLIGGAGLALY